MSFAGIELFAIVGFVFAAYAVVGNDALQTLGTFIHSNRRLHWSVLFLFAAGILVLTFAYGWVVNHGDPSYGRLANTKKYGEYTGVEWYHILPPLVLLIITRLGIPVSTSFMVLTIFASFGGLASMIDKSLVGYAAAFAVGAGLYLILNKTLERHFEETAVESSVPRGLIFVGGTLFLVGSQLFINWNSAGGQISLGQAFMELFTKSHVMPVLVGIVLAFEIIAIVLATQNRKLYWATVQWVTTGYLWSVWLIQDFANIFVFLPRQLTIVQGFGAMVIIMVLLAFTFANQGGPVQRILRSKSNVTDIRSATIIDFLFASLLFFFKEVSNIPMSTTWVFLGLIAGREYAFAITHKVITLLDASRETFADLGKAFIGLVISIDLAVGLPMLGNMIDPQPGFYSPFSSELFLWFVIIANLILPIALWYLFSKSKPALAIFMATMALAAAAFFSNIDQLKGKKAPAKAPAVIETTESAVPVTETVPDLPESMPTDAEPAPQN